MKPCDKEEIAFIDLPRSRGARTTMLIANPTDLEAFRPSWNALVSRSAEANVFLEPDNLTAAVMAFGAGRSAKFLFVMTDAPGSSEPRPIGFFPLEVRQRFRGAPLVHLAAWQHTQLYLGTPLVDRDNAVEAWQALLAFARGNGYALIEWPLMAADGKTKAALEIAVKADRSAFAVLDRFERATVAVDTAGPTAYLERSTKKGARREWRRQRNRLAEQGVLQLRALSPDEPVGPWLDDFLALEARGWKGGQGTALACSAEETAYFRLVCGRAHACGQLHMLGLYLDGAAVAMQCNLVSGRAGFAFKVTYDEKYARYSPGTLLELDNVEDLHTRGALDWMDSCTRGNHSLMHRIWAERRTMEHLLIAPGSAAGRLILALYPHLRRVRTWSVGSIRQHPNEISKVDKGPDIGPRAGMTDQPIDSGRIR